MTAVLADPKIWASFFTLAVLEVVLGIDNLVFLALLAGRLPEHQQARARRLGLALALLMRLALLGSISWLVHLTDPVLTVFDHAFSWRDIVLLAGGGFLLYKGTREIHLRVEGEDEDGSTRPAAGFATTVVQIVLFDIVFSLDSVITAVGIADELWVMVAAIVVAMALMRAASGPLAAFIDRNASVKMLALSFLLLIGMMLVADGFGFHVPRGYVYGAMGFSGMVEALNLIAARRRKPRAVKLGGPRDMSVLEERERRPAQPAIERGIEAVLFGSRWLMAPIYLGLIGGMVVLLAKFVQYLVELAMHVPTATGDDTIVGVLKLVDLSLMGSLVLMVMFSGYENFVSTFNNVAHADKPSWLGHIDFTDLKLKLMGSIVAISAIKLLESFMNASTLTDRELGWDVGIHMAFVVSALLLALSDRLSTKGHS